MSGNQNIIFQVEINPDVAIPKYKDMGDIYRIIVRPDGMNREIMLRLFDYVMTAHDVYRLKKGDVSEGVMVILPWGDDKHPKNFNPFGAARAILDAVSETRLGPISATLLVEQAAPDAFCEFLIGLPKCIETFCVGLRDPNIENISADVWESLPKLQTINVSISRPNQGIMEPRNTFKRPKASHPRDDEPETTKRARTEVIDFATCTATVFLVPAFEEEASNAQTFQIAHERPIKFRAVAVDEIPGGEAFSLIDGPVNTLRPTADLRHVIDMVYVTEDSVKRIGVKPNIDASVVTGTSVWGRAVFLKK